MESERKLLAEKLAISQAENRKLAKRLDVAFAVNRRNSYIMSYLSTRFNECADAIRYARKRFDERELTHEPQPPRGGPSH